MVGSPTWNVNNTGTTGLDGSAASGQFGFNTLIAGGEYFDIDNDGSDDGDLYIATSAQFDPSGNVASPLVNNTMAGLVSDLTRFDYDQALAGYDNKISYMTPVFNGFQMGASYTPDVNEGSRGLNGNGQEEVAGGIFGSAWEISARYEGQWDEVGISFGGGYTHVNLEDDELKDAGNGVVAFISADGTTAPSAGDTLFHLDDREAWNVGLDLDWMAFGLGAAYTEQEAGLGGALEADTWTVGADYTTGPFKFGLNYYSQERDFFDVDEIDTERYSAGVVYTYGPGMTFRGSVNYTDHDTPDFGQLGTAAQAATNRDQDATSVLLGTQINF
jgi:predicted porin